jgi:cytochrome c oxidase cbb3-type subunit IV
MDLADAIALFSVIALSVGVLVYVYWPSNKKRFDEAGKSILRDEDKPSE